LRERREDIPRLVQHFLKEACERFGTAQKPINKQLTPEAMRACVENPWRGNVRSLRSAIEQAVILSSGDEITPAELFGGAAPEATMKLENGAGASASQPADNHLNPQPLGENGNGANGLRFREAKEKFVSEWERDYFVRALRSTNGNISRAAEKVGMYRQSFQQKMRELGISVAELGLKAEEE
jgi:DNA-binding NtrC family response regulator